MEYFSLELYNCFNLEIEIKGWGGSIEKFVEQFPNLGVVNTQCTDKILYNCKKVGVHGWSLVPPALWTVPKKR